MLQSIFIDIERLVRKNKSQTSKYEISGFLKDMLRKSAGKVDRYLKCSTLCHRIIDDFYFFFVFLIFFKLSTMKLYHLFNNFKFLNERIKKHTLVTPSVHISKTGPRSPPV